MIWRFAAPWKLLASNSSTQTGVDLGYVLRSRISSGRSASPSAWTARVPGVTTCSSSVCFDALTEAAVAQRQLRGGLSTRAHIIQPVQFSHCLVVVNGAPVRLTRVNLFQTLISFVDSIDAKVEFRFGLFANNKCRLMDGTDNRKLGL